MGRDVVEIRMKRAVADANGEDSTEPHLRIRALATWRARHNLIPERAMQARAHRLHAGKSKGWNAGCRSGVV
jgi:hypothetical protein